MLSHTQLLYKVRKIGDQVYLFSQYSAIAYSTILQDKKNCLQGLTALTVQRSYILNYCEKSRKLESLLTSTV